MYRGFFLAGLFGLDNSLNITINGGAKKYIWCVLNGIKAINENTANNFSHFIVCVFKLKSQGVNLFIGLR